MCVCENYGYGWMFVHCAIVSSDFLVKFYVVV
jgi:hypothetical protein